MTIETTDAVVSAPEPSASAIIKPSNAAAILALVMLADWLFYRHDLGVSVAIFLAAVGIATLAINPIRASRRELVIAILILLISLIPLVVQPGLLAMAFGILGVAQVAIATTETGSRLGRRLSAAIGMIIDVSWRAPADLHRAYRARSTDKPARWGILIGWIVPLGLGTVFLLLLSSANPLIEGFIAAIDIGRFLGQIDIPRVMLWLLMTLLIWPFIFIKRSTSIESMTHDVVTQQGEPLALPSRLLDGAAILRSLLLFNALFAVQSVLDIIYLWGGVSMPAGTSYAAYAHRGAYPLIVTALLAAAFVIVTLKPGGSAERSRPIRALVFLWIGQNVMLVISSILRLDLYVEVYSLTGLRLAAGIWMALVAAGLILIVVRIALGRSNQWLVGANLVALALTLYAVSLFNQPAFIADYNVEHSRELSGKGQTLDIGYIVSLGPHAIPALDRFIPALDRLNLATERLPRTPAPHYWAQARAQLSRQHLARLTDWRAWGYYDARLAHYLATNGTPPLL